jgi:rubrerythrin
MSKWTAKQGLSFLRESVQDEKHDVHKYQVASRKLMCPEGRRLAAEAARDERKHKRKFRALLAKRLQVMRHLK